MGKDLKGKDLGKGISQRKDGRYIARFTSKLGERKTFYDFKLQIVKKWLNDSRYEDVNGVNGTGEKITLNEWFPVWIDVYKKKIVKMTTIYKNTSYYNSRIRNTLGKMYIKDIKLVHVQKLLNNLFEEGLSHGTISNIRFLLSDLFDKAILNEYISKNPCEGIRLPTQEKIEKRVLTIDEQKRFFDFTSNYTHINVFKLAITTGCRIGEVLGLQWSDINFENKTISINKTIHYSKASSPIEGSKFFYTSTKTTSSNRIIPMNDEVRQILQNQKTKQTNEKIIKGKLWKQHKDFENLVFTCSEGSPVYYYNVNDAIKDYVEKMNIIEIALAKEENREAIILNKFTCHTFRHTFATRCFEKNIPAKVVQTLLGHSNLEMTNIYTHVTEEKKIYEIIDLKILE